MILLFFILPLLSERPSLMPPEPRLPDFILYDDDRFERWALGLATSNSNSNNPSITLEWQPVMGAVGYNVYYGPGSRTYTNYVTATTNHVTVPAMVLSPRWYSVTAFNELGLESDFSEELAGANLRGRGFQWLIGPGIYQVQMSTNLIYWQTINPPFVLDQEKSVFRLKSN